jgi:hypothetical protein
MLLFPCHLLFLRRKLAGAVSQPLRSHAITAPPSPLATETVEHSGAKKHDQPPHPPSTGTIWFT